MNKIVVNILYSGLGGHSSVVFSLIEADQPREYDHVIIFYGIEDLPRSYIEKCAELRVQYFFVKKKQGVDIPSQNEVVSVLRKVKPGIILLHSVNLILPVYRFTLMHDTRLISVEHQPNHLKTKREWLWSVLLMRLSYKVVYLTDLYGVQMKKRLRFLYNSSKVNIINNGINTNLYKPSADLPAEEHTIGMLARVSATKDHITLVEALSLLISEPGNTKLRLKIAGDGDLLAAVRQRADELGIGNAVDFLGMIPEHLNPPFLNALGIYVHASLGETMSTSLMQAMACAKPIIASDVPGINNMIIPGKTGILVPPKDSKELAKAMNTLLADPALKKTLSENALQFATTHYSNKAMFASYRKLFP